MSYWIMSLPDGLADFAESAWGDANVEYECISAGAGSAEYTFANKAAAQSAHKALMAATRETATFYEEKEE
jgi:hypothetical protein